MSKITWYNDWFMYISVLVLVISVLFTVVTLLICLIDDVSPKWLFLPALTMILSFIFSTMIIAKQNDILENKYKYIIKVIEGKGYNIYYTNSYEIKNGLIYFDGNCANNFTVKTID